MENHRFSGNRHQILSWMITAGLAIAPLSLAHTGLAQQAGQPATSQAGQQGQWGPAGPPPDAQNGQVPPPPAAANTDGQAADDAQAPPPPPPPPPAQGQQPAQQGGQQGQWGPAGPPPDVQNGQIPPQPGPNSGPSQYEPAAQLPSGPVTIPAGTLFSVRTNEPLNTKKAQPGDFFQATVVQNVYQGRFIAVPRGAQVTGRIVDVKKAGDLKGGARLTLQITSLNLGPQPVALTTDTWSLNGPGKGAYTANNAVGGAALGAVIGAIAGGGPGAAIGAVAGTGAGLGAAAATPAPRGVLPPEAMLTFHLTQPVTVQPVSAQEVRQLAQNLPPPPAQYGPRPGYPGNYAYPGAGYPGAGYPGAVPPPPAAYYASPYGYAYPYPYAYPYGYAYPYPYRGYYRYGYRR